MEQENLELKMQISEKYLEKARKDFERASLVLHFGGEIVGMLYYTCFKGLALPCIQNWTNGNVEFDYKSILTGLAVYAVPQIPAFFLKGLSMTQEENRALAKKFKKEANETKEKGRNISAWVTQKMSRLHYHFANNHERYDKIVQSYSRLRKKLVD